MAFSKWGFQEEKKSSRAVLRRFFCAGPRHTNLRDYFVTLDIYITAWVEVDNHSEDIEFASRVQKTSETEISAMI